MLVSCQPSSDVDRAGPRTRRSELRRELDLTIAVPRSEVALLALQEVACS